MELVTKTIYASKMGFNTQTVEEPATLNDIQAWLSDHGLVAVPLEPTEAMLIKAAPYLDDEKACIRIAYQVLIAAAQEKGDEAI